MATMHPTDIENYGGPPSERELYAAFRDQLPEKYQVFYSIRWFETSEDNKRVDSECDFLVFDPSFGFSAVIVYVPWGRLMFSVAVPFSLVVRL